MKQVAELQWTIQEREIVQKALTVARKREIATIIQVVQERASDVSSIEDVWLLNDFLSARRFELDGKYDGREDEIPFVLARLTKDGWLLPEDLVGLESAKLSKIKALTRVL
jgi:hypothetical protein